MNARQSIGSSSMKLYRLLSSEVRAIVDRWQPPPAAMLLATAFVVGLATGVGAVTFRYLIRLMGWIGYVWIPEVTESWGRAYAVFTPAVGGLLVGLLVFYFAREAKGHGVPEVMEAVALHGGRIRPIVAAIKALASSICIGSGGSVGREGPIVQIGSALGSTVGQMLKLSDDRVSNLVACGAAGGIAATFNAPIAGVMFALEVILGGRFGVRYISSVVVAAVTASVIGRVAFGDAPAFAIPFEYGIRSLWEFALYPILGVLAALVGALFTKMLYGMEDVFDGWRKPPEWVKPAVGGALLGALALAYPLITPLTWERVPHIYNVGYEVIEAVLANQFTLSMAALLLGLKLLATTLTLGSGGSGGVFAPSLFMGAMLGAAFAMGARAILPDEIIAPGGAYALVGMAAVFAAAARAPVTAILILFELTGDYRIILPLMLTVVISVTVAHWLLRGESIYTLKLTRRGVRLQQGRDVDVMEGVFVREVMDENPPLAPHTMPVAKVRDFLFHGHHHGVLVLDDEGLLVGVATLQDVERVTGTKGWETMPVSAIMTRSPLVAYPDESIGAALQRLATRDVGRLPVVARDNPRRVLGLIRRTDIARAYQLGLLRRDDLRDRANQLRLTARSGGTEFIELVVEPGSAADGRLVREIPLPAECLLTTRRHNNKMHLLHGNDRLEAGDIVLALCEPNKVNEVRALFQKEKEPNKAS